MLAFWSVKQELHPIYLAIKVLTANTYLLSLNEFHLYPYQADDRL